MLFPDARVLIFAKAPEPGRVKTRLIPALGPQAAADLQARLLADTVDRLAAAGLALALGATPAPASAQASCTGTDACSGNAGHVAKDSCNGVAVCKDNTVDMP